MNPSPETGFPRDDLLIIIPAYQEAERIAHTVTAAKAYASTVLVVDDGSTDDTADHAEAAGAEVKRVSPNRGKGRAMAVGFDLARKRGAALVVTLDADGQHDPADIPRFIEAHLETGAQVVVGSRFEELEAMPTLRKWTNRTMTRWLSKIAGQSIPDSQSGYRLYSREAIPDAPAADRYAAESEILLALARKQMQITAVPIKTVYQGETSHIRPIRDTFLFFKMLWRMRKT